MAFCRVNFLLIGTDFEERHTKMIFLEIQSEPRKFFALTIHML